MTIPRALLLLSILLALSFVALSQLTAVRADSGIIRVSPNGLAGGVCGDQVDWSNACDLQYALGTLAVAGDELWVETGTYTPTATLLITVTAGINTPSLVSADPSKSFQLRSGIALYGGFAGNETERAQRDFETHVTILSGDLGGDDTANPATDIEQLVGVNSYTVVNGGGTDATAVLDGFTVTAGLNGGSGAGMRNVSGSPTIRNVIFSGNRSDNGAGLYNQSSSPILDHVIFVGNETDGDFSSGGGMSNISSSPQLTDVVFDNNTARHGGGLFNSGNSAATLNKVTFLNNNATRGAGLYNASSTPILANVTFYQNIATEYGGGIYNFMSSPQLNNVTFSANEAGSGAAAIYNLMDSDAVIRNSILWNDVNGEMINSSSAPQINDSLLEGGCPAGATCTNVFDSDPQLGPLADNGGFTQTMSIGTSGAAIDAGDNATCEDADQRGVTRPQGAQCDIGAFERVIGYVTVIKHVDNGSGGSAVASDWTMNVTGTNPSQSSFPGAEAPGVKVILDPGAYQVTESGGVAGYVDTLSADCAGNLNANDAKTCTITNTRHTPTATNTPTNTPTATATATATATMTSTPCPIPPALVAPADGSTVHGTSVHFNWKNVSCATRYILRIRRDSPTGPVVFKRKRLTESKLDVDFSDLGSGTYLWRVRACEKKVCSKRSERWNVITVVSDESWRRDDWMQPGQAFIAMR